MNDLLKDRMVSCYFLTDAVLPHGADRRQVFARLASAYGIPEEEELFAECNRAEIAGINTVGDYYMYERVKALRSVNDARLNTDCELDNLIAIKGQALIYAHDLQIKPTYGAAETEIVSRLSDAANAGVVAAMLVYGFILCEGIYAPRNRERGLDCLRKAARWNSTDGAIACLYYDPDNAQKYVDTLYTALSHTPYALVAVKVGERYNVTPKNDKLAKLLEEAFARGIVKRERYDHQLARVIYADSLNYADKQQVALSASRELVAAVSGLPLNVKRWQPSAVRLSALPFRRTAERKAIEMALNSAYLSSAAKYRPICICGGERYVLGAYAEAIRQTLSDCNVVTLEVANLPQSALDQVRDNVILSALKASRHNAVVFEMFGEVSERKIEAVRNFLKAGVRGSFKLENIGITLDLSGVFPVCIADKHNAELLKSDCNVLSLAPLTAEEKRTAVTAAIEENKRVFKMKSVKIEPSAAEKLALAEADVAVEVLDKVFQDMHGEKSRSITCKQVERYINEIGASARVLGFGG